MKKNIKKRISSYDPMKGYLYSCRMGRNMFMVTFLVFGLVMLLGALIDHSFLMAGGSGLSIASMALIGNIDDVSDRDTHGSDISYIVYLVSLDQIDKTKEFPQPNKLRQVGPVPMKPGEVAHYFEAHDIPSFVATTEKGDITTTGENTFVLVLGGNRVAISNFIEEYSGGRFIAFYKHVKDKTWYILGETERPLILSSTETKDDKDGRYSTITFKRPSVDLPLIYTGNPVTNTVGSVAADQTTITITANTNTYHVADGTSGPASITEIAGLTKSDKGRYITLVGDGKAHPATIADGNKFVLEDGTTWTAKQGASITFQVLDTTTLIEVSRIDV